MQPSNTSPNIKASLQALKKSWPSPFVAREQVGKFSGGTLNPRTLANHDSQNNGPKNRVRIGRKIAYPVDSLVEWMEQRSTKL